MQYLSTKKEKWDKNLQQLLLSHTIFAVTKSGYGLDYEFIKTADIPAISYNKPKPASPLKNFFLPFKENVTSERSVEKPRIIIGIPNCDIEGLSLLDEIYLDNEFTDNLYKDRRENTLLISADCFSTEEHCHCLSYDIKPYTEKNADLAIVSHDGQIIIRVISEKGKDFISKIEGFVVMESLSTLSLIEEKQKAVIKMLDESNKGLPAYSNTGILVNGSKKGIWEKYSAHCVSCGACTTICPTCSCFLLIDKPGFEKVKQMDACQYPGFERVAGGEDVLFELHNRYRNRYMCKYVWKSQKFKSLACTGCGRCIEACIGKINKNELFRELAHNKI
jgi:sulfhydrogenase subunit beta (sulfur reductase)